jgi:hypothetical protein
MATSKMDNEIIILQLGFLGFEGNESPGKNDVPSEVSDSYDQLLTDFGELDLALLDKGKVQLDQMLPILPAEHAGSMNIEYIVRVSLPIQILPEAQQSVIPEHLRLIERGF